MHMPMSHCLAYTVHHIEHENRRKRQGNLKVCTFILTATQNSINWKIMLFYSFFTSSNGLTVFFFSYWSTI